MVKEIHVSNQAEFDAILDQAVWTQIRIESEAAERIIIGKVPKNCYLVCGASSQPTIRCWASSQPTIECWASSQPTIECWASSQPTIECWEQTTLVMKGDKKQVKKHQQALVHFIEESNSRNFANIKAWLKYWEVKPKDGKVTLYKAIRPDFTDFYTGKIHYTLGSTVECPDWIENYSDECGHGFHCSPHQFLTERYVSEKHVHIAFEVDLADICLPSSGDLSMPDKIRVRRVQNIMQINEKGQLIQQEQNSYA